MSMTREEFLRKRELDRLKRLNPTFDVKVDGYGTDTFLRDIQAYEDVKEKDYGVAYELTFPNRKVIAWQITDIAIEIYYYERGDTKELEGSTS